MVATFKKIPFLTVTQDHIFWAMVNAIKELKEENDGLKEMMEGFEARLGEIEQLGNGIRLIQVEK